MIAVTAVWKTERRRSDVRTPSGRSQTAGAVRRCDVRRLRLCGLPRVVRREEAVPRMLENCQYGKCGTNGTEGCTEVYLPDPYKFAMRVAE